MRVAHLPPSTVTRACGPTNGRARHGARAERRPIRSRASSISCCGLESWTGHSFAPNTASLGRDAANFRTADAFVVTVRRVRVFAGGLTVGPAATSTLEP